LSGLGEPLLHPQLFEIIRYCKQNESIVNFPTNLSLSNTSVLEGLVRSGIDQIKVSIDAANAATYKAIRGQDKFDVIINNIRTINRWKKKTGCSHPEIRFNYCLQRYNLEELPKLIHLARELSISSIYIQDLNYFSVEKEKSRLCGFSYQQLAQILDDAYRLSQRLNVATNILNWKRNLKLLYNKTLPKEKFQSNSIICSFPWISTFIDVNGCVKPCPVFVWDLDAEILGNCLEEKFIDIWHGEQYRSLRRNFCRNNRPFSICLRCVPPRLIDIQLIFTKLLAWRS
jgi:MoaA/NifB/PqqE/SkfB family radical SAM enzyme